MKSLSRTHQFSHPAARWMLFLAVGILAVGTAVAAPMNGREVTLMQPDGTTIKAKAHGDEFFNWLETDEGQVVVRDFKTNGYVYARLSANGDDYESTGIPFGRKLLAKEKDQVQKLEKKIRISPESRQEKTDKGLKSLSRDQSGRIVLPSLEPAKSVQLAPSSDGTATNGVAPAAEAQINPTSGTFKALSLLAYFPDFPTHASVTMAEVNSFYNDVPYSGDGNAVSVRQYFKLQSQNQMDISHVVTDWYVAPNNLAYYNVATPTLWTRFDELAILRLEQLKAQGFDFRQLDGNGDGKVDCVSLFFAYTGGWIGGWAGSLTWSGFASYGLATTCPYQVSQMADPLELAIATHELGHAICGFPDLYPYNGNAANAGIFCLMAGGSWSGSGHHPASVSAPMKLRAGWVTAVDPPHATTTNYTLNVDGTNVVRHRNPNNSREYYLFEMRGQTGYEGPYGGSAVSSCPSNGLVVYHVYEDGSNGGSSIFTAQNPNCDYSNPPEVLVVEDNPQKNYTPWYDSPSPDSLDAFDTGDVISDAMTPDLAFWSSRGRTIPVGIQVSNIQVNTSNLTFTIQNNNPPGITATPSVVQVGVNTTLAVQTSGSWTYAWTKVSGPGAATFGTPSAVTTTANFNTIGNYVVRVTLSDGVKQVVSEITVIVSAGVNEYLGIYKSLPVSNDWHTGWIEIAANKLQWRNAAGVKWNLSTTSNPDVLLTGSTPYGTGMEFVFLRENGQIVKFTFNGGTYSRCNPIGNNLSVATPKNVEIGIMLTASDADSNQTSISYSVVTPPANGALSGTAPNLTYTPNANFAGGDAFTFKANDGTYNSNIATASIIVYAPGGAPKYRLSVLGGSGDGEYPIGEQATITADAAQPGKEFDKWLGDVSSLANPNSSSTTLTMPASNVVLTASYKMMESLKEYVGYYSLLSPVNTWQLGWIEIVAGQLRWQNQAGVSWNLFPGALMDVLVVDPASPNYPGQEFLFGRVNGRISQFMFQSAAYLRFSPVAVGSSVYTLPSVPVAVTLTASDPQSNPMTYAVVTQPTRGTLSGTAPNLTYTPASGFTGTDSFTFKANDGQSDSNLATISIVVRTNVSPVVGAGPDQNIYLVDAAGSGNPVANAYYEWDAAKDTAGNNLWPSSTTNTYTWAFDAGNQNTVSVADARFNRLTRAYAFPAAKDVLNASWSGIGDTQSATFEFVLDVDNDDGLLFESGDATTGIQFDISGGSLRGCIKSGGNTYTVSHLLTATDKSRYIHVVFVVTISNKLELYVDGVLKNSVVFNMADWSSTGGAGLGNSNIAPNDNKVDFTGKLALFRYYKDKALSSAEVITNLLALSNASVPTNLDGSVVDADDLSPATTWSLVSTAPAGLSVLFGNASSIDTTVTFTQPGTYTLRLTANDGYSQVTDDVVITVGPPTTNLTVTYNGNGNTGGTVPVDSNSPYTNGATVTVLGNSGSLTRTGYTFNGWNTAANGTGTAYAPGATFTISTATTLHAQWTANTYTVTFNGNNGVTPDPTTKSVTFGSTYGTLATTSRTGYTFAGWFTAASGGTLVGTGTAVTNASNHTLHAQWTANTYTVTFNGNGGGTPSPTSQNATFGSAYGTLATATHTGYTFNGWFTAASGGTLVTAATTVSTALNHTLYAQWTTNSYTVTFDANGGAAPTPTTKSVTFASTYGTLATTSRTSYTFAGWFTAASGGTLVTSTTSITNASNHTLYAQWLPDTYIISYNGNGNDGGNVPANHDKLHDINLTLASNSGGLTKTGSVFTGWNTTPEGNGTDYPAGSTYTANSPITLYAKWTEGSDGTWLPTAGGTYDWGATGSWVSGIVASGADRTASFTPNIVGNQIANLESDRSIGTITFTDSTTSSNDLTISGANTLTLARSSAAPVIDVTNRTLTISSNISGDDGMQKNGAGILTLSGNNNYTGQTTVTAGQITVAHNNALGSSAAGSHTTIATVGKATPRIAVNTGITTAENITITGATEVSGGYNSPLTASGTYSGTITLAGSGAIRLGAANWTGTITQSTTSHKLVFVGTNTVSNPMTINGADLTIADGTTTLSAANGSGIGNTDIYNATLKLGVTNAIRIDRDLTFNNVNTTRFNLSGFNQTIRGLITTTGTNTRTVNNDASSTIGTLTVGNGGGDYSFGGTIINNTTGTGTVALTKVGTGTQTLTGTNTYTGATTIHGGTLVLTGATQATTAITFTGGSLGLNTGVTVTASSAAVNLTNGTIQVTGSTGAASYTLLTAASITGTPTLASPVSGYTLQVVSGNQLRLVQQTPFGQWAAASGLSGDDAAPGADPDGDGLTNLQEFAFGTLPNAAVRDPLELGPDGEVTKTGSPVLRGYTPPQGQPPYQAVFGRRKNHAAAGLIYTVEFSADLTRWTESNDGLEVLSTESTGDVDAVSVPFPLSVSVTIGDPQPPKFFRVAVATTP